jgi:hypothetical protein
MSTKIFCASVGIAVASATGCATTESAGSSPMAGQDEARAAALACTDVPNSDRDDGPFVHRDRIAGLEVLRERLYPKAPPQPTGVAIYVRATPGLTEPWLGRIIECTREHHRAVASQESADPLLVADTRVAVSTTPTGYRITIRSADPAAARAVIEKGQALIN